MTFAALARRTLPFVAALVVLTLVWPRLADAQARTNPDGWQIPASAAAEANPVALTEAALARGKSIYQGKCQRCHGPGGKGDGPEADPEHKPDDLTDPARAARNPDGVMFYKVWNGRKKPKMPAYSLELSREEAWTVVHYVKTLRKP